MLTSKPDLWLCLDRLQAACDAVSEAYEQPKKRTRPANWAAYVMRVGAIEQQWVEKGWLSPGGFRDALVLLVHRSGGAIKIKTSTASLLLTLTTSFETRQHKATWAKALQPVLDGQLDPNRAAELGVKAAAEEAKRLQAEADRASRRLSTSPSKDAKPKVPEIRTRNRSVSKTGV